MSRRLRAAAAAALAAAATGCSSFFVTDYYASSFDATNRRISVHAEQHLSVVFVGDTRFGSLGPMFLPIVPVFFAIAPPRDVELEVDLVLKRPAAFSLAWRPCLSIAGAEALCARGARVWKLAQHAVVAPDGGTIYEHIDAINRVDDWNRTFVGDEGLGERFGDAEMFAAAGYAGDPPLAYLNVVVRYAFSCPATCPERFSLDAGALALVDGAPPAPGVVEFRTERRFAYDAIFILQ